MEGGGGREEQEGRRGRRRSMSGVPDLFKYTVDY